MKNILNWQARAEERAAMDQEVLKELTGKFKASYTGVAAGSITQPDIDRENAQVREYREWLSTQDDMTVINAYTRWLGFFEEKLATAQKALDADTHGRLKQAGMVVRSEGRKRGPAGL